MIDRTIDELIKEIKSLDYYDIQRHFDPGNDGGCPCFWCDLKVEGKKIEIHGHCWRTCQECAFNGLHVTGALSVPKLTRIAKAFKSKLDKQKWYSKYDLVIKSTLKK